MATQIDELSLKIDIEGASKSTANNIKDIASAIRSLNNAVSNSGALKNLKSYSNSLQKMAGSIRTSLEKTAAATTVTPKMVEVQNGGSGEGKLPPAKSGEKNAQINIENTTKALKEQNETIKKGSTIWSKFTKAVGRIALYRAIRTALKNITQAAIQGLENVRSIDKELDKSLKTLSQSSTSLKNSFASMLAPIIESVTPIVTKLSDGIATIVNRIAEARAALSGSTTYTKILTSDTKEWQEQLKKVQGYLLSFDKFEALNKNDKGYTGVTSATVGITSKEAEGLIAKLDLIKNTILSIVAAIALIKFGDIISNIDKTKDSLGKLDLVLVGGIILSLGNAIQQFKDGDVAAGIFSTTVGVGLVGAFVLLNLEMIKTTGLAIINWFQNLRLQAALATTTMQKLQLSVGALFIGITALVGGISLLVASWGDMGTWQKMITIFAALATAITAAAIAFHMFSGNWGMALGIGAAVAGGVLMVGSTLAKNSANKFANGGIPETGTLFYAGEAGAEIVSTSRTGQTGVANVEQISQAMLQALINYNAAQNGQTGGGNVYLDGRQVGQLVESSVYNEGVRVGHFKRA